ncbi:MAG: hypothetical protein BJ554DRAFT_4807 [Olpidium bornovanus]|uniref:Uncharacterized protein n=1 Tax=Olpidium bornovanus TaxID=278681 RepID=A0A8H8DL38_9FUNG|nr:MAG: hypothetical protein BJ554DRAFT_4807 [Olpidium bornovanus]
MSKYAVKGAIREPCIRRPPRRSLRQARPSSTVAYAGKLLFSRKNYTKGYSDIQAKVRQATSNGTRVSSGSVKICGSAWQLWLGSGNRGYNFSTFFPRPTIRPLGTVRDDDVRDLPDDVQPVE